MAIEKAIQSRRGIINQNVTKVLAYVAQYAVNNRDVSAPRYSLLNIESVECLCLH